MLSLKDLVDLLDRWEAWKTTRENAAKVPALEARIAELEALLNGKAPAEFCRKCGERAARLRGHAGLQDGMISETFVCEACGARDNRFRKA